MEIVEVDKARLDTDLLYGHNLEVPKVGNQVEGDTMQVIGWVPRRRPVSVVEIAHEGKVLQTVRVEVERPDVAERFPDVPGAKQSGYRATVATPDSPDSDLVVRAVLSDESTVPLGTVRAREKIGGGQHEDQIEAGSEEEYPYEDDPEQSGSLAAFFRRLLGREKG